MNIARVTRSKRGPLCVGAPWCGAGTRSALAMVVTVAMMVGACGGEGVRRTESRTPLPFTAIPTDGPPAATRTAIQRTPTPLAPFPTDPRVLAYSTAQETAIRLLYDELRTTVALLLTPAPTDREWQSRTRATSVALTGLVTRVRAASAPPCLSGAHGAMLRATAPIQRTADALDQSVSAFINGRPDIANPLLSASLNLIKDATVYLDQARIALSVARC